jgi:hypothetical protein
MQRIAIDTYLGMAFSNLIAYFIILTVAVTLHAQGKNDIDSAPRRLLRRFVRLQDPLLLCFLVSGLWEQVYWRCQF